MEKKFSHKCIVCGKGYDSCFRCKNVESWRNICCSTDCFQKYIKDTEDKPVTEVKAQIKKHQEKISSVVKEDEIVESKDTEEKKNK